MAPSDLEGGLLTLLDQTDVDPSLHLEALSIVPVPRLPELAGIGIDTNILKRLRQDPIKADNYSATFQELSVPLIIPSQCITEYWNNHDVFSREDMTKVSGEFQRLRKSLENLNVGADLQNEIDAIGERIQIIRTDLEDTSAPDFLAKSTAVLTQLLSDAMTPKVSRTRFSALAEIRSRSKVPPGFADDKKAAPLGDIFVWWDFLLGILTISKGTESATRPHFLWATEDSKPDWKASGSAHPGLVEEALRTTGARVSITNLAGLDGLLADAAAAGKTKLSEDAD